MGIVEEVGSGVTLLTRGDRVVVPFNVADGRCRNCEEGKTAFCTGGAYAEWHGVELSSFAPGESLAVFGAGPVGLMAGHSAVLPGAARVFVVDRVPERLRAAEAMGCISVDFTECDAVEQIIKVSNGMVDRSIDAQVIDSRGSSEQPNVVLENMIRVTRPCGGLGIPGLYVPSDPGAPDTAAAKGSISLSFGKLFEKGLRLATGQCNVKAYNRYLRDLIIAGKAKPSFAVSHEITLDDVEIACDRFDKRLEGYTKVLIHPNGGF
ncbi:glutathione-independent formaldehyde dehydrogenase [Metarhizium robertsii ARSEF 23]|uniref:Glutathione-independent formaldehyde dehydrogenase n=1 Tax=Metarhizium robertsii (strain ARSEF 23 / ATCC MYA-3075) TaxID=655844 RepID=E9F213_METRA|nr:glutathione-independent formaldehyde dehydrogenase [Metarhizium robertsii ARSEF 23]EFY98102.2 glutathione-independent formaldehyde dehydrogenase [Metarhizium robertsii ARSEF 23]